MKNVLARLVPLLLVAAVSCVLPRSVHAQTTNKAPTTEKKSATTEKKQTAGPFHGKLAALDKAAKTITIGKRTFHVSPETKIMKNGKPATLEDGVVNQEASGYFKTGDDGKLVATKVTLGPKVDGKAAKKTQK